MDYTEAIGLALAGEQRGFSVLYEKTYQKKYFLALQYMKNESEAEDVMQEAYIKAFSKLDTLKEPEKFPTWFGMIVANVAKNALKKKMPILFSDITSDDEKEVFEYQIEDNNIEHMPETAYTREETRQLTYELMDSLSEEQRMCILMFHIEGMSIKEIASELGCVENTVKSRLKYGRDNIKEKGEELQKKGYQLYSVAPLPMLLYLLQKEAAYMEADGTLRAAGVRIAERVIPSCAEQSEAGASGGVQEAAANSMKAVKSGFIHTVAGKVTIAVVILGFVGGTAAYVMSQLNTNETAVETEMEEKEDEVKKEENEVKQEDDEIKQEEDEEKEDDEENASVTAKEVQDSEYETLIAGNLTKEELQFVLAYGPQEIPEQGFQSQDYYDILNSLCIGSEENLDGSMIESYGPNENWIGQYSLSDVNRMFRSFTDYQLAEGDSVLSGHNVQVQGNAVVFAGASLSSISNAVITSASYTEEEMEIYYTYDHLTVDMEMDGMPPNTENRKALLKTNADGLYQIVTIEVVEGQTPEVQESEGMAENTGFPVGAYGYVAGAGGYRGTFTIDSAGIATYMEWSSGTGKGHKIKYQMINDDTVTVPDGMTAYVLQFIEGNDFQMTDDGDEVTGYMESGDNLSMYYDANHRTLQDANGTIWELVE